MLIYEQVTLSIEMHIYMNLRKVVKFNYYQSNVSNKNIPKPTKISKLRRYTRMYTRMYTRYTV